MNNELAEQLTQKRENLRIKIETLNRLDTKRLVNMLPELEEKLEAALREEAAFKDLNAGFIASGTNDCAEVKRILADLTWRCPVKDKTTAPEREAWLVLQRTENEELVAVINRQKTTAFGLENIRVNVEMTKKRLENIHRVLALRTAQIEFLR